MTLTIPEEVKARAQAYATYHNNRASRIVETAICRMLGDWGTDADQAEDADQRRELVAHYLNLKQGK